MADKDGHKWTLSVRFSQWEQPEPFSRQFQDSKYVGEKNVFFGGRWSDFSPLLFPLINQHETLQVGMSYQDTIKELF